MTSLRQLYLVTYRKFSENYGKNLSKPQEITFLVHPYGYSCPIGYKPGSAGLGRLFKFIASRCLAIGVFGLAACKGKVVDPYREQYWPCERHQDCIEGWHCSKQGWCSPGEASDDAQTDNEAS